MQDHGSAGIGNYGIVSLKELEALSVEQAAYEYVKAEGDGVARFSSSVR
ncbi:hypothetical protein Aple_042840 [Acrocarpospora pleiomorpha]|uniref:Uncharacterized protein n=1 Tax=Acrocarpospora pleiomorpha TaxID=90975 RepID=A0A5M3XSN8_9ACTN|nr:hypothetical protein [Acrocarpospora pleiomorpha]GES21388.1 hypothetical protein Aple_042840 [Acrocarpospora pleiomorpha]